MTKITWASVYCRIPTSQYKQVAAIARKEHGGKIGRYLAALIQADLTRRAKQAAKAKKGSTL